jgi:hypothetical protein
MGSSPDGYEAAIVADYDAQSAVDRELVLRLAGLLWRLRRGTKMETGLLEIQANYMREFRRARQVHPISREVVYALFRGADSVSYDRISASHDIMNGKKQRASSTPGSTNRPDSILFALGIPRIIRGLNRMTLGDMNHD